jgi:streptomycin 6-kinase
VLHLPPDAPVSLVAALSALGAVIGSLWREGRRAYVKAESATVPLFARYSTDPADVPVLEHEANVRRIVGQDGALRTPPVLDAGNGWLIEARKDAQLLTGDQAVDAVLAAAGDLSQRELPRLEHNGARAAAFVETARRRLNLALSALSVRDVMRARTIVADSPLPPVTSHGDLHIDNVLMSDGRVWVIDWEMTGRRPAGYDLMQFWATLPDERDRSRLWTGAVELVGNKYERPLAALRYALAVRTIANKLCSPAKIHRDRDGARRLLALLPALRP